MSSCKSYLKEAYKAIYQNDFQKAILAFKKAINCDPTNASYYHKLSITYSRNGDMKEALAAAKKAYELSQNQNYRYHLQILQSKNLVLLAAEKIDKGIFLKDVEKMLIHAKTLDPLNIDAYFLLGIYYGETKLYSKSIKEFNLLLNLNPYHQKARQLKEYFIKLYQEGEKNE
ncbi:hypothetical protein BHF71_00005 [Vulcanibacillus modesticaldus]|uniref:Uncharacterized protein n=1 Tax=Vulcanibacillus modesticaldus TaxID=337097 RepID=A0A1D2YX77_9BACI|nr:tetratricopeptide repeat protein [Vulcanibacillus modesticaldus]OEG00329.1 hypothetical protein BHF71_00005 [Vulcanibacillus modesticaldus]